MRDVAHINAEFTEFWATYPHRVAKLAAKRAYVKARRSVSAAMILAGVQRYIDSKPTWQEWAHPSSWLNAGRWMDEPPRRVQSRPNTDCPHEPCCRTFKECRVKIFGAKAS